jgi:hypothetical protein
MAAPVKQLSDGNPGGTGLGQSAADLISAYGATPVSQRSSSNQTSSNLAVSASFGASQLAIIQEIMNTLTGLGLWKGL